MIKINSVSLPVRLSLSCFMTAIVFFCSSLLDAISMIVLCLFKSFFYTFKISLFASIIASFCSFNTSRKRYI